MITWKTFLDFTNLFPTNAYKKNYMIICKYSKDRYGKRKRKP